MLLMLHVTQAEADWHWCPAWGCGAKSNTQSSYHRTTNKKDIVCVYSKERVIPQPLLACWDEGKGTYNMTTNIDSRFAVTIMVGVYSVHWRVAMYNWSPKHARRIVCCVEVELFRPIGTMSSQNPQPFWLQEWLVLAEALPMQILPEREGWTKLLRLGETLGHQRTNKTVERLQHDHAAKADKTPSNVDVCKIPFLYRNNMQRDLVFGTLWSDIHSLVKSLVPRN